MPHSAETEPHTSRTNPGSEDRQVCLALLPGQQAGREDPAHHLTVHLGDQIVIMVVVQYGNAAIRCGRGDQQVGRRDPTMPATVGEKRLDLASSGD